MALPQEFGTFFCWFCYKESDGNNVVVFFYGGGDAFFYGGGDVKKAMALGDFYFFFYWSLWFSSLELTINNEMVFLLFRLKDVMARRRRLRKSDGGDLEVHKQNVTSSDQVIAKENVVPTNQLQIVVFSH
jgi:hypothetical protein